MISKLAKRAFLGATLALTSVCGFADDTEVFINNTQENVAPNLMFLLDLSGSMEFTPGGYPTYGVEKSRLEILKESITSLLSDPELPDINIGLSTFQNDSGGTLLFPIAPMNAEANSVDPDIAAGTLVKEAVVSIVDGTSAGELPQP